MSDARSRRPVAIDLYAGAGGLSFGLERAGFDVVAAAEMDPIHALTHRFNLPRTPVLCADLGLGSVSAVADRIRETALEGLRAHGRSNEDLQLDAIVGGPPCQGFSVGGVRQADDDRNNQLLRFVDLVIELQPKVFCLENVAGLLEARFAELRNLVLDRLEHAGGYNVTGFDESVDAADFGVPQRRRRVLVLGSRIGPAPMLRRPDQKRVTVADALEGLPDITRYRRLLASDQVTLRDDDLARLLDARSRYARRLVGLERDVRDLSYPRPREFSVVTNSLRTVHTRKSIRRFSQTLQGQTEPVSRLFRLESEGQSRTLRAGSGSDRGSHTSPRPVHPERNRVITVREASRLHGYPDWFRFHATNWHGHRQVGNSVPPPLATAAGRALARSLGELDLRPPSETIELGDPDWLWFSRLGACQALETPLAV